MLCVGVGLLYAEYDSARGQIKSVDKDKIVVAVRAGMDRNAEAKDTTYLIDKDTTIRVNGEKKTIADLAPDKFVTITFKMADKAGDPGTAVLISVFDRPAGGGGDGAKKRGGGAGN